MTFDTLATLSRSTPRTAGASLSGFHRIATKHRRHRQGSSWFRRVSGLQIFLQACMSNPCPSPFSRPFVSSLIICFPDPPAAFSLVLDYIFLSSPAPLLFFPPKCLCGIEVCWLYLQKTKQPDTARGKEKKKCVPEIENRITASTMSHSPRSKS